jgi:hypothetical protein
MDNTIYILTIFQILCYTFYLICSCIYSSTRRIIPAENTTTTRNVLLTNRDSRVLKHMIFMFSIYTAGWTPIYVCIVTKPQWFNFLIFDFMELMPQFSMLIDIVDLFIYNHRLRNYLSRKNSTMRRYMSNTVLSRTIGPVEQVQPVQDAD